MPVEVPWIGDGAPGFGPAQLHALVAGAPLQPLPDDGPEICRGRKVCFIPLGPLTDLAPFVTQFVQGREVFGS